MSKVWEKTLNFYAPQSPRLDNFAKPRLQKVQSIPNCHKGESKEESKQSSKFSHERRYGIDQLVRLDPGAVRDSPQGDEEVVGEKRRSLLLPDKAVSVVGARLPTA